MGGLYHFLSRKQGRLRDATSDLARLCEPEPVDYVRCYLAALPISALRIEGYPAPFFIRFDDQAFGLWLLGRGYVPATLPGFYVWHEAFQFRNSQLSNYYLARNGIATMLLYRPKASCADLARSLWRIFFGMLYTLRYRHAGLMLRGVADALRGAEILDTTDAEPFADLIAVQLDPAAPISADRRRRALAADAPPRSLKRRMIARLSLGGRLLPPLWPRREVREALTAGDPLALLGCSLLQAGDRAWLDCDARPCPLLSPPGGRSDLADSARPGVPSAAQIVPEKARGSLRRGALVRPAWARAAIAITSPRILRPARTALRLSQSLASLAFVQRRPIGRDLHVGDVPANTLNWVVPPPGLGSGGHKIIFRFVPHFEALGFDCRIVVGDTEHLSLDHALQSIRDCFLPIPGPVYLGMERALPAQVTIAANWATDYLVRDFLSTRCRRYFVQDFELWFYPTGSEQALAEAAHRLSFHGITAGTWLRDKLTSEYRMTATAVGCSYDRERCAPGTRRPPSNRTVLFYASPPARRRSGAVSNPVCWYWLRSRGGFPMRIFS